MTRAVLTAQELLSVAEVAKILKITRNTVSKWCRLKKIEHFDLGTESKPLYRISRETVERRLRERFRGEC